MGATKFPLVPPPQGGTPNLPQPGQPAPMRPDEFQTGSIANFTTFGFDAVSPPSSLYIQRDDVLLLQLSTNIPTGDTITFNIRFLQVPQPGGGQPSDARPGKLTGSVVTKATITNDVQTLTVPGLASAVSRIVALGEGYILSIAAVSGATTARGRSFVRVNVIRGFGTNIATAQTLIADYATSFGAVGYPGGRVLNPTEGPGLKRSIQVGNPAAGVDWSFLLGTNQRLRLESFNAVLTTSAVAGNRQVQLVVDDGASIVGVFAANANLVASTTNNVTATAGSVAASIVTTTVNIPVPTPLILEPTWHLRPLTVGILAADQWTNIFLNVEEWLEFT